MCRSLKVLCSAQDPGRLSALKRAAVGAAWELVGGASSVGELREQVSQFVPDVVVVDADLGPDAVACVREANPAARVVCLGSVPGADAEAAGLEGVRAAIMGLPRPGGPVMI